IMPLPDKPWERGKCGLKLIQYMAAGLPVIASPVGANTEIVDDGVEGFLADDENAWYRSLSLLADDPDLRHRMGSAGRFKVEARFTIDAVLPRLSRIIREAAGKRRWKA
ncbi:MAG: glycosyltransferase family 4 protein, partial [Acidobacteriota bacterium]